MTVHQPTRALPAKPARLLLAFTLSLAAQTALSKAAIIHPGNQKTSGCASWAQKTCITCFNSVADTQGNGCVMTKKFPNCLLYNRYKKGCQICAEGYASDPYNPYSGCQKHEIKGCLVTNYNSANKQLSCFACKGGNPNLTQTACVPFDGSGKSKNCFAGTIFGACGYCNKGFSVDEYGNCLPQRVEGCARVANDGKCIECDFVNGYFVDKVDRTKCTLYHRNL